MWDAARPPTPKAKDEEHMTDDEKARVDEYEKSGDADEAGRKARVKAINKVPKDGTIEPARRAILSGLIGHV